MIRRENPLLSDFKIMEPVLSRNEEASRLDFLIRQGINSGGSESFPRNNNKVSDGCKGENAVVESNRFFTSLWLTDGG